MNPDPQLARVVSVVGVGTSPRQPGLYEVHLEVRPESEAASKNLILVFQSKVAEALLSALQAKPPNQIGQ